MSIKRIDDICLQLDCAYRDLQAAYHLIREDLQKRDYISQRCYKLADLIRDLKKEIKGDLPEL